MYVKVERWHSEVRDNKIYIIRFDIVQTLALAAQMVAKLLYTNRIPKVIRK